MHQQVCIHSKGLKCLHCARTFPSVASLWKHTVKHSQHEKIECTDCDSCFISATSYATHRKGVHGKGYLCPQCGGKFKSPAQRARHLKKCG